MLGRQAAKEKGEWWSGGRNLVVFLWRRERGKMLTFFIIFYFLTSSFLEGLVGWVGR